MDRKNKGIIPVIIFFLVLNGFFILRKQQLADWGADQEVLLIGNVILFAITLISYLMLRRSFGHSNPNVFVRSVFGSFMIKLFVCLGVVFIYVAATKKELNKPALFTCMGLYLVYTAMEVGILMKLLKKKTNG